MSTTPEDFAQYLHDLRLRRRKLKKNLRPTRVARQSLSPQQRTIVFGKTGGRCHICGGNIVDVERWHADHVFPHSGGGHHKVDNYLPAHAHCNVYRWDYTAQELQEIIKLGVWIRIEIERKTPLGLRAAERFLARQKRRDARRKPVSQTMKPNFSIWSPPATQEKRRS